MDTTILLLIALLAAIVVIAVSAVQLRQRRKSEELQDKFGPVYKNTVQEHGGDRKKAEDDLEARAKRVEAFDIHNLQPGQREQFQEAWRSTQAQFVDAPDQAVEGADRLVQQVMRARGYPVGDFDQRAADLSVNYPNVVTQYQAGHAIAQKNAKGQATTEDLRQAMVHYRALFEELLRSDGADGNARAEKAAETNTKKEQM